MVATTVPDRDDSEPSSPLLAASDRFDVGPLLGRGGMGEVRLARDLRVDRDVAIKLLRGSAHPDAVGRFLREARVQGRLEHPAIVPVYDCGVDDAGVPYFAMKRLAGVTLAQVLATEDACWPRHQLLARFVDVCLAIELAHTRGIVHRDLKPSNIMLGDFGEVYVLDWGIASIAGDDAATELARGSVDHLSARLSAHLSAETATGALLGTPGYMAPEQIEGRAEPRTDVFALGLVLFEILAGKPALPRGGEAFEATLAAAHHRPSVVASDVPPELDDLCARATARDVHDRPTARGLADAVTAFLAGHRDLVRRRELVDGFLAAAEHALARDDHPTAMREVGRAVALDPEDGRALAILRRVLLEPSREVPPEALAKREAERIRESKIQLGIAQKVYACFLLLMPFALLARTDRIMAVAGTGLVATTLVALIAGAGYVRRRMHLLDSWLVLQVIAHGVMLAIMGTIVGPFQIVPMAAVVSLALFLNHPGVRRFDRVIVAHLIIAVLPIALELVGLTPSTFAFEGQTMKISMLSSDLHPWMIVASIVATVWILQIVVSLTIRRQRRAQEQARDRLHLYSWRLEQLLPKSAEPRVTIPPH